MSYFRHSANLVWILLILCGYARAQNWGDMYTQIYGEPIDVSVKDLAFGAVPYAGRAVRTKGVVEIDMAPSTETEYRRFMLQDGGYRIGMVPRGEVADAFEFDGLSLLGRRVQLVGLFETATGETFSGLEPAGRLVFWSWTVLADEKRKGEDARSISLEELVDRPARFAGRLVRIVGEFRGRNLYGDLPARSLRNPTDWVIRNESHAVWITDKKPQGKGWSLSTVQKRDTGKWLVVVGRANAQDGIVYVRASSVALTSAPRKSAEIKAPVASAARPQAPPVVVFTLPLDGETMVPSTTSFAVQFSKDMDPGSFQGRILLRYGGPRRPGDRLFESVKLEYDAGHRALRVDPGDLLRPGREVELLLLPGIRDKEGLDLVPRAGHRSAGAVDILRYGIGS